MTSNTQNLGLNKSIAISLDHEDYFNSFYSTSISVKNIESYLINGEIRASWREFESEYTHILYLTKSKAFEVGWGTPTLLINAPNGILFDYPASGSGKHPSFRKDLKSQNRIEAFSLYMTAGFSWQLVHKQIRNKFIESALTEIDKFISDYFTLRSSLQDLMFNIPT
jgi:hypothetical protein